jgi:hypothetical protein
MKNAGGQPLEPDELDDEVQKIGKAWGLPGFSSKTEPPEEKESFIASPETVHKEVSQDIKERTSKKHVKGFRGRTKMINKVDKEDKKPITFELDKVQKRRMKVEGRYNLLARAKELNIVPETERFPFHESGAPDAEKLNPLLSLFFTEAWWKMSTTEKKEYGWKKEIGLTNGLIKRYFTSMMHDADAEKFKGVRFNITTNIEALMKKLHENQCRKKKAITGLLDLDKSGHIYRLKPDANLESLGYVNFLKLLESSKSKGLNRKAVTYMMTTTVKRGNSQTPEKTNKGKSGPSSDGLKTDLLNASDALDPSLEDEAAKSALTETQIHGVHIKIIKRPDGTIEMDFQL